MESMSKDELEELPGIGPSKASELIDANYTTIESIATASEGKLTAETSLGSSPAKKAIRAARNMTDIGGFQTGDETLKERKKLGKITIGVDDLDDIMGGGIEEQAITEFYGPFKSGKSQMTHQLCVNVQLPEEYGGTGKRAALIDTESSYRPERIIDMVHGLDDEVIAACMERDGIDGSPDNEDDVDRLAHEFLKRIHDADARNTSMQIMAADNAVDLAEEYKDTEFPLGLVVVDSIIGHFRAEYVGRGNLADRQQKLGQHLDDLSAIANDYDASIVLANQVHANPDQFFGDPNSPSGGNVLGHRSTFRIKLREAKGDKHMFSLEDAPNLKDQKSNFMITEGGIDPA